MNEDYRDILHILSKNRVDFLMVCAYTMSACGYPRATGDIKKSKEDLLKNKQAKGHERDRLDALHLLNNTE